MAMEEIQSRGKAIENAFFGNRDKELLQKLKAEIAEKEAYDALGSVSGIEDKSVLEKLAGVGVTPESLSAVSLIPLVSIAWCDDSMEATEKQAILDAAAASGIEKESAAAQLLDSWLGSRPGSELQETWKAYVGALKVQLDDASFGQLKSSVINRAETIAEAAGGFFGLGSVSDKEKKAIADLAAVFG